MKRFSLLLSIILILAVALAACGGADANQNTPENEPEVVANDPAPEPVEEVVEPTAVPAPTEVPEMYPTDGLAGTEITFWHAMSSGDNLAGMEALVAKYNETNEFGITVVPVNQGRQGDLETAINGAIATGELPNMTMGFANGLARWYGLDVIASLNDYIADPDVGITDDVMANIYAGPFDLGTLADGAQVGIPMHQSEYIMFYNFTWAEELGFAGPPATSAEFKEQACAASAFNNADDDDTNDNTGGLVYYPDASWISSWIWAFDGTYLTADGEAYDLNNEAVYNVAVFLKDLYDNGCTLTTPSYPNPEFAARQALFSGSSSAGIPYQGYAMSDVESTDVWGTIPFPGPNGTKTVNAMGQMIGVIKTNADQDLASWLFLKWLTSPETQSEWVGYTGYFPSQAGVDVGTKATDDPIWGTAYELLPLGVAEPNLAAHGSVRSEIRSAFFAIIEAEDGDAIQAILDTLNADAADLVADTE